MWRSNQLALVETMTYNIIPTDAIFQLLEEKGLLTHQKSERRIEKLRVPIRVK
jgi:hypothetical protein